MQRSNGRIGLLCVMTALCFLVSGCGGGSSEKLPDLEKVTGTVTLDGKPAANVAVKFEPQTKGGNSTGTTNDQGKYELTYAADKPGAAVGGHLVRIVVANEADAIIQIPKKYNSETELKADVQKGKTNEINFELTSK